MPQLDIIFILTTYVWTWSILIMMVRKIRMMIMINEPKINPTTDDYKTKPTPVLPWT